MFPENKNLSVFELTCILIGLIIILASGYMFYKGVYEFFYPHENSLINEKSFLFFNDGSNVSCSTIIDSGKRITCHHVNGSYEVYSEFKSYQVK